jgi:hypothetical protein
MRNLFKRYLSFNQLKVNNMIKVGYPVKVNDNILQFYNGLKQMHGRVGRVEEINEPYAKVNFAGKTKKYQRKIPIDCLDKITEEELTRRGTIDALNTSWKKQRKKKNKEK